jgi:hypothetical protein
MSNEPGRDTWRHLQWPSRKVESFVVSFPKSGRTWLRVLLAVVEADRRGEDPNAVVSEWLGQEAPTMADSPVLFTHALASNAHERVEAMSYFLSYIGDRRRVFLVRDPRDTIVSYFFQVTKRQRGSALASDIGKFVRDPGYGIERLLLFLVACDASLRDASGPSLLVSYEELHAYPQRVLAATAGFLGCPASTRTLASAVTFAEFDNMRRLELEGGFGRARLEMRDANDVESLKTRKGVVGGYAEYLSRKDVSYVEGRIGALLPARFGYREPGVPAAVLAS